MANESRTCVCKWTCLFWRRFRLAAFLRRRRIMFRMRCACVNAMKNCWVMWYVYRRAERATCNVGFPTGSLYGMERDLCCLHLRPRTAWKNCICRRYFTSSVRGIGSSFQLAITAPQINFIGYGTATAQS